MPSQKYIFKSNELWKQYRKKEIDYKSYMEQLENIKEEEIGDIKDISIKNILEENIYIYEDNRYKLINEQRRFPQEIYTKNIPAMIKEMRNKSKYYRKTHNTFQCVIIIGSILVTSFTSAIGYAEIFKPLSTVISILVGISAGLTGYFKYKEKSFYLQRTADAIEQEYIALEQSIGFYKGKNRKEALILFIERIEILKEEQKKREQSLEQPPEVKKDEI